MQRHCGKCLQNCPVSFLKCPSCKTFTRCFVEGCCRFPNQCVGSTFLICSLHLKNLAPILMTLGRENTIVLPPPQPSFFNPFFSNKKGSLLDRVHQKRQFPLPSPEHISNLRLTVKKALKRSRTQSDIKAAQTLMEFQ